MDGQENKANLREAISNFCNLRINEGKCDSDECEFCPVSDTYDMTREDEQDEFDKD